MAKVVSVRLKVYGRVQGVGFRPFVYRLATALNLKGYVLNSSGSVEILLQGERENIEEFQKRLIKESPPLSVIDRVEREEIDAPTYSDFTITPSRKDEGFVFISPDIAVCEDCLREMRNPEDRRYRYPFINCTNCGPRYTIIEDMPYDRDKTTMKKFKMCRLCKAEYEDPLSRRFHAQPNSCFDCGPSLWIEGIKTQDIFKKIAELIKDGKILAIKGLGGFHIACDATNNEAVKTLRERKKRPHKPFALMMKDIEMVKKYCYVTPKEEKVLTSPQSPIVLLRIKDIQDISPEVAPHNKYLGVMLPYTPYHYLMFDFLDVPLVMTSANFSDSPVIKDNSDAKERLSDIVDFYVLHDRDIRHRVDDSVVFVEGGDLQFIRRARGYAPDPVKLPIKVKPSLALGPELKNTFTLAKGDIAIPSPHIGDLKNQETLDVFEDTIMEYIRLFRIEPDVLISDMHPAYMTTELAKKFKNYVEIKKVQHHKAHIYSLLLDIGYTDSVIGFAFDGTGYGEDGKIWGGEVFVGSIKGLKRALHFEYFPIAGGDSAVMNPRRIALSYLHTYFPDYTDRIKHKFSDFEFKLVKKMVEEGRVFHTSSLGRIFDLVSSLIDIRDSITYEAQAAIELEMAATESQHTKFYDFDIKDGIIEIKSIVEGILKDKESKEKSYIARKFHNTIVEIIKDVAEDLYRETGLKTVGFSGGVFQNRLLLSLAKRELEKMGFNVLIHRHVPTNDGGISLGQLVGAME